MRFAIVDPVKQEIRLVNVRDLTRAERLAGLDPGGVDHGTVPPGLGIVVYEFGLYSPPAEMSYFAIGGQLYAGAAVLYAFSEAGETVDVDTIDGWSMPDIEWLPSYVAVEEAIEDGRVARPAFAVNGEVLWRWPQPKADHDKVERLAVERMSDGEALVVDGDTVVKTIPEGR